VKAIVSFIRSTTILKKISVVQKNADGTFRNFRDKVELVQSIQLVPPPTTYDAVMYVKCGCGREFVYTTFDDIPSSNVTCVCGQLVIVYGS
jgi:hypothetical protein